MSAPRHDGAYRRMVADLEARIVDLAHAGLTAEEIAVSLRKGGTLISGARVAECIRHYGAVRERRLEVARLALQREISLARAETATAPAFKNGWKSLERAR